MKPGRVFNYEKTQKELLNAPKAVPLDKPKISQRIRGLVEKRSNNPRFRNG
jgi:hypothetical protein